MAGYAVLDVVLLVLTLISVVLGFWRGLIYEVVSIVGWIAAFILAPLYAQAMGQAALPAGWSESWRFIGGYVLTFIAVVFASGLIAFVAKKLITGVGLRPIDRVFGAVFGLARAAVLMLGLLIVVRLMGLDQAAWWKTSQAGLTLSAVVPVLKAVLPEVLGSKL